MNMFTGEYLHKIDEKKRLAIPAKMRALLGEKAIITKGLDNCLFLYPIKKWQEWADEIGKKLSVTKSDDRAFQRLMLGGASDVALDGLGRILVPDNLKKYAGLSKKVIIAGIYDRIEIWDEEKWESHRQKIEKEADDIAERINAEKLEP